MAAPRSNLSVVHANTDRQSTDQLTRQAAHQAAAAVNSATNGDRNLPPSNPAEVLTGLQPDDQWVNAFESLLVQAALDNLFDGVLIVNVHGDIIRTNHNAQVLLNHNIPATCCPESQALGSPFLEPQSDVGHPNSSNISHPLQALLDEIWRVCLAVIDSRTIFPQQDIVLDSEVSLPQRSFRIRVRWMHNTLDDEPCLIVSVEDLLQTAVNQVNGDRWKYKLTPRETEVWRLKRRGYSYRAIAQTLYVSENTVKKHLKNIQAKRRAGGDFD
ncbi:MAG: helix-turn-helix transcriptional regulator [Leptolyngbyaceae cyanobacterium]